jgi:CRP-like cAMP-binding protein
MMAKRALAQSTRSLAVGEDLFATEEGGKVWILLEGSMRLDRRGVPEEERFGGLAVKGDILGAEILLLGSYTFCATALTPCRVQLWADAGLEPEPSALLRALVRAERRGAEALALRCGEAAARVRRLVALLGPSRAGQQPPARPALPRLRDMAEMTALTVSTVSRTLVQMQAEGGLEGAPILPGRPRLRV